MKVCVVGQGGREHALAIAIARSSDVVVTPGNPGMPGVSERGYRISITDRPPQEIPADLYVIGPEQPLVEGLADELRGSGRLVFGPGADGAVLEGSKAEMKRVLNDAGVPTARFGVFDTPADAKKYLRELPGPWVIKTDGLASGKGVLVTDSIAEAESDIDAKLSGASFGDAGRKVVVEEGLSGPEFSLLAVTDGKKVVALAPAQDFKRVGTGDTGPNTGGMGAYSPVPSIDDRLIDRVLDESVEPTLAALRRRGIDYRGVLYAGLMLTVDGPKVLEFNVRFGDPETQVVLPRFADDLTELLSEAASGKIRSDPKTSSVASVCVVLASVGYPTLSNYGDVIEGLDSNGAIVFKGDPALYAADPEASVTAIHSGTSVNQQGQFLTSGGRVIGITATGSTVASARSIAYSAASRVGWSGVHFRTDIAAEYPSGES